MAKSGLNLSDIFVCAVPLSHIQKQWNFKYVSS